MTAFLLLYCMYMFNLNESTSLVDFRTIGKRSGVDIYPSISICPYQLGFISESKLQRDNITSKAENYKSFLFGKMWDSKLANINYDHYTLNLQDYVTTIMVDDRGATKQILYKWTPESTETHRKNYGKENLPFHISYRSDKDKCFSLDVDKDIMKRLRVNKLRTIIIEFENFAVPRVGLNVFMHYPKQLFHSLPIFKIKRLKKIRYPKIWLDSIVVSNMIAVRRRNTNKEACDENWQDVDDAILKSIAGSVGCQPQHWKKGYGIDICNTSEKMREALIPPAFNLDTDLLEKFNPPCHQLHVVMHESKTTQMDIEIWKRNTKSEKSKTNVENSKQNTYPSDDINSRNKTDDNKFRKETNITKRMEITFQLRYYEEIKHIRAFDIQSLIGNVGGYIGMFLGFAMWQLPDFLDILKNKIIKWTEH